MRIAEFIESLREADWTVRENPGRAPLPAEIQQRYKRIPPELLELIESLAECVSPDGRAWFLTSADFSGKADSAFAWNEWEKLSDEFAANTEEGEKTRRFWDAHLPILHSVKTDYQYLACRVSAEGYGSIVKGGEPEFEECIVVADSFTSLLAILQEYVRAPSQASIFVSLL